ncbi:hypothetical protein J3D48_002669 [Pseudomonas fluorescens]|uniref:hypothetical protein n=1 Tax=Pseudomonas fluorescens TaxID=294 RepID=UPI00209FA5E4|nr:hypothetical protein [Pseudomonas fluorescens]MCP1486356.1 hypothetical protein [Pseudomonas fluorescens]
MTTWNLEALKNAVHQRYGREQEKALTPSLNSIVQRGGFAKFHYSEAKRLMEAATAAHIEPGEMMMLILSNDTANAAFQQARFQAAAHITACVQNMHSTADILAHAVYFALGMNLDPALSLKPHLISIGNVMKNVTAEPIITRLTELVDHDDFRYLSALNNHSKHRSIVDLPYSLDLTTTPNPSGLKFAAFKYKEEEFPARWAMQTLDSEYGRQSKFLIGIGQALNSTLIV